VLPWSGDDPAAQAPDADGSPDQAVPAVADDTPPAPAPRVRRPRPPPAPDDWKKGISIFGGG